MSLNYSQLWWNKKIWSVGRAVTRSSAEREVYVLNLGPVKSDTVLPTTRHRCNISKEAVLPIGAMTRRWASPTRCILRRNAASIMKNLIVLKAPEQCCYLSIYILDVKYW